MDNNFARSLATSILGLSLACGGPGTLTALGQTSTTGTLNVTVLDPAAAVIPNANLELRDIATNDVRRATTETVTVTATETPLVQTEASTVATTLDTKQVVNLPIVGRSVFNFVFLTPGWASTGSNSTTGTFNNMPGGAVVAADFDGTPGISNRFRSGGYAYGTTVVQPRIENVAEMTVQTAQLDLSGNGTSAMKINIVSRRGSNQFHGRLYEDFRNTVLNANSWLNNARTVKRPITKLNEFGGSVGGPAIKNKLFFFGTWAERKQPATGLPTAMVS